MKWYFFSVEFSVFSVQCLDPWDWDVEQVECINAITRCVNAKHKDNPYLKSMN
jgi:hypothetical protein